MSENTKVTTPVTSADEELKRLEIEIKKAELEAKLLEKQEREYSIKDMKARLADRDIKEKQQLEDRESSGRTFAQQDATDQFRWQICTHKKGGTASNRDMRVLTTGGNSTQYAVIKHQMITGDIWVRCLRCGKTWSPPVETNYFFDARGKQVPPPTGKFDIEKFEKAKMEYRMAVNFETNNSMSGSVQCRFSRFNVTTGKFEDAVDEVRDLMKDTNLR